MRPGDWLILTATALALVLLVADGVTGGAVGAWSTVNLPGLAQGLGGALGQFGLFASPLLAVPLLVALLHRIIAVPPVIHRVLRGAISWIERATASIGGAARWFALGLVIVTATIVIQRYVFGYASTKLQESVIYMHALLFLLASASTLLADGHVRVDIFYSKASKSGKAWIDLWGTYLALMPMGALILWASTGYMNSTWRILEQSRESDGLPFVFLLKTAIPLFAIMLILQGFAMACRAALTIADQEVPPLPKSTAGAEI
jgi:TRAP-type mannitol/chloroaromatic compound transport system permease small subunit